METLGIFVLGVICGLVIMYLMKRNPKKKKVYDLQQFRKDRADAHRMLESEFPEE